MALFTLVCVIFLAITGLTSGAGVLPDSVDAALGGTVVFNTSLAPTQTPFLTVTWQFGTKNIISSRPTTNITGPEYKDRITLFMSTGSLELRAVALNDTGEYRVNIVPALGPQMTGTTRLNVYEKISEASVKSSTPMPLERTFVNLTCDASGSIFTREWTKDGLSLKPSENIVFYDQNQVVSFKNLNRKDTGSYTCKISNPISSQDATYVMNVNSPKDGLSAGAIVGITIVCLVVVGGAIAGGLYVYKNKNGKKQNNSLQDQNVYENTSNVCMFNTDTGNKHIYENTAKI